MQDELLCLNNILQLLQWNVPPIRDVPVLVFITAEDGGDPKDGSVHTKYSDTERRLSPYERLRQKTGNRSRKKRQRSERREVWGRGSGGWGGGARAGFPDVAAVAWLSVALKITAFTLQLKNSSSDHLFSRKSSSSIVFPRPLQPPHHRPTLLQSLASFQSAGCVIFSVFGLYRSRSHSLRNLLF